MPEMSGKNVLEKLLKINPETKMLLASGYSEEDQSYDLLERRAVDFIGKPFIIDKLLKKIRGLLD